MKKKILIIIIAIALFFVFLYAVWKQFGESFYEDITTQVDKPVIYLYPEERTDATVKLQFDGELTCTYPEYDHEWKVTAYPNGTLVDVSGRQYNYLYWEGDSRTEYDFSKGFVIKGEDTAEFLEEVLAQQGLTRKEANEFIVYWLPQMEGNPYNIISFQTDRYTKSAQLTVTPKPDHVIRVFMAWKASNKKMDIEPQTFAPVKRDGFTVVEWGGTEIKS